MCLSLQRILVVASEKQPHRKANVSDIIPPVDYSFLHLSCLQECYNEEPREISLRKKCQIKTKNVIDGETKNLSHCLRLNNNQISNISNLMSLAMSLFDSVANVEWIDLSFNILQTIDPVLVQFENLKILYLHGNNISEIKEVNKLAKLSKLWKLTLHGNDIEKVKGYRYYVLAAVPNLISLDFSTVTKGDIVTTRTWKSFNAEKPKKISQY